MKISIILPIYNVEKYLEECFKSIFGQIDDTCEIILVDDGSKDISGKMCDDFAVLSRNIKVIHKENGGLASARNAGLKAAKGDYVIFIDSDDRIAKGCIEKILKWIDMGGTDICFMQAVKFFPDGKIEDLGDCIKEQDIRGKKKNDVLYFLATRPKFPGSSCTKIYRRTFLVENNLMFPLINIQAEDLGFVRDCIMKAKSYDCLDIPFYEYRQNRTGSITNTVSQKSINGLLCFVEDTVRLYSEQSKAINPYGKYALSFGSYEYGILLYNFSNYNKKNKELYNKIYKYKWILNYSFSKRQKIIKIIIKCLGINIGSRLIRFLYMIKNKKR